MPNWASTAYFVTGEDKALLYKFWLDLKISQSVELVKDAKSNWLGNLYIQAGYKYNDDDGGWKEPWIACRGWIDEIGYEEDDSGETKTIKGVTIFAETAWSPLDESFQIMLNEKYPGLRVLCRCEEPGMEIYYNSDVEGEWFTEAFCIDAYDYNEYYSSEEGFLLDLEKLTGIKFKSFKDIQHKKMEEAFKKKVLEDNPDINPEDLYIYVHEYTA